MVQLSLFLGDKINSCVGYILYILCAINRCFNHEHCPGLGMSDHLCISFKLIVHTDPDAKADPKFHYHKGDYDGLNNCIWEIDYSTT